MEKMFRRYQSEFDYRMDPCVHSSSVQGIYNRRRSVMPKVAISRSHQSTRYSARRKSFYSPIPANAYSDYAPAYGKFDITRLGQTAYLKLIQEGYPVRQSYQSSVSLAKAVQKNAASVGAIWSNGCCSGSGILISENLMLVPRHTIAGFYLSDVSVEFKYWTQEGGNSYAIDGVVEEDGELDYAIIALRGRVGNRTVVSSDTSQICVDLALLHHPLGKPLQVSVHAFGPANLSGRVPTYHDTDYNSSGGAYIDPRGRIVAMHLGSELVHRNTNLVRHALPFSAIVQKHPLGLLAQLISGKAIHPLRQGALYLAPLDTPYLIDEEGEISQKKLTQRIGSPASVGLKGNAKGQISTQYKRDVDAIKAGFQNEFAAVVSECLNHGGVHGLTRQYSITRTIESDHVPPYDVWAKSKYKAHLKSGSGKRKGENLLPAVTIPWRSHRDLATTGSGRDKKAFRQRQVDLCNQDKMADAISLNLDEYASAGLLPSHRLGVRQMLDAHVRLGTISMFEKGQLMNKHSL